MRVRGAHRRRGTRQRAGRPFRFRRGTQRARLAPGRQLLSTRDVSVAWLQEVPAHFHARYSALARSYRYLILNRDSRSALAAGRATWERRPLDARAHAGRGAGSAGRARLQRVPLHRVPGQVADAARGPHRGHAQRCVGHALDHRQCLSASHGAQRRRTAHGRGPWRVATGTRGDGAGEPGSPEQRCDCAARGPVPGGRAVSRPSSGFRRNPLLSAAP